MKARWHIKDLIDLEYFLHVDSDDAAESRWQDVRARDRRIYLDHIKPQLSGTKPFPRRWAIRTWLERRRTMEKRSQDGQAFLPGEWYDEISRLLGYGLFIAGGLTGLGLAFFLLTYTGTEPLNVSVYLATTVFVQILLLLVLLALFMMRLMRPGLFYNSAVFSILSHLIVSLAGKLKQKIRTSVSGSKREGLSAVTGLIRGKNRIYGSLLYWPVFIVAQLYGIGFNLGVLTATLLRVLGTDLAFGWQSTLQVSAEVVYKIVKTMAIPWSWFVPSELAYPSLAQIEGSRLILKDGIYHLATLDLVAWWPFLCFAVLFYGLLPRVVLYISGVMVRGYLLRKVELNHAVCDRLIDRMVTPRIEFGNTNRSGPEQIKPDVSDESQFEDDLAVADRKHIVLIPDDILEGVPDTDMEAAVGRSLGGRVTATFIIDSGDTGADIGQKKLVREKNSWTHVLILKEAWQPPIVEDMSMIRQLRHDLGNQTPLIVGLTGKPEPGKIFTPVAPVNWRTWKEKIMALGDPYIRLERLAHDNN